MTALNESLVCSDYHNGLSARALTHKYNLSEAVVWRILRQGHVTIRNSRESHIRYKANHTFFDNVTTDCQAYFLGLLAADGNVCKNRCDLMLKYQDRAILSSLRKALEAQHPIKMAIRGGRTYVRFGITSPQIVAALRKYHIGPAKSLRLRWPSRLPCKLNWSFLRGLWDGDGHVGKDRMSLCGSKYIIAKFRRLCVKEGIKVRTYRHCIGAVWYAVVSGVSGRFVASKLYQTNGPALLRKRKKALSWIERYAICQAN